VALAALPVLAWAGAYRHPWPWDRTTLVPLATRALLGLLALAGAAAAGAALAGLAVPSPGRLALAAGAATAGVVALRLALGRARRARLRRGAGIRAAVAIGDAAAAARLAVRLERHAWLGERLVGRLGPPHDGPGEVPWLGERPALAAALARPGIATAWLLPPPGADLGWLPPELLDQGGASTRWRILPEDFARVVAPGLAGLAPDVRARLLRRLRHDLALPTLSVAMVGSRGVPAAYSGIERYVEEVGSRLAGAGAAVTVYCHRAYVTTAGPYRGMALRFPPTLRTRHLETWVHVALASLDALVKDTALWHYQALGPSTWAWLPRLLGRRVVVTVQGLDWQRAKWGRLARLYLRVGEWASARLPHRTIVVSRVLARHYAERYGIRPVHIPNGFVPPGPPAAGGGQAEALPDPGLQPDGYLLFVGRLSPEKGCHTLIEAFGRVRTGRELVLAGAGNFEDAYTRRLQTDAARAGRVRFLGFVTGDRLHALYRQAALVVHPSQMEGLSVTLLEALSHGCPLLVSDVPENLEAVGGAAATFRVDDPADLAAQLQRLLDDDGARQALRGRAREASAHLLDWDAVTRATREVYESVLAPAGTRSRG
jgi:glycosyltransferase involved in cell wall biosynthesis